MKKIMGLLVLLSPVLSIAQEEVAATAAAAPVDAGLKALSAAIAISVAALGGAIGQGMAAGSALDGIARNPAASGKIFTPFIIAMALIESLVILGFVVAMLVKG